MKGEMVIVRAYGDEPLALKIWEVTDNRIYVCDGESYQRLMMWGVKPDCFPVAFPRENVYHYSKGLFDLVRKNYSSDPTVWDKLRAWRKPYEGHNKQIKQAPKSTQEKATTR